MLLNKISIEYHVGRREITLLLELLTYNCSFWDHPFHAYTARLAKKVFCTVAGPMVCNTSHSPSLLFMKPDPATEYVRSDRYPADDDEWSSTPFTVWTWLDVSPNVQLEDDKTEVGSQFVQLLVAPDRSCSQHERRAFRQYGRRAISWGRTIEAPRQFSIVMRKL